jgi:hypothetical protein
MELEHVKDKLNKKQYEYFLELSNILELPLFFNGSITRIDFVKDKSDFDIAVFSDNITFTKMKIEYLFRNLDVKPKFLFFFINDNPISSYKYALTNKENDIFFDIMMYNKNSLSLMLQQMDAETNAPFYIIIIFIIIKFLHYNLYLINGEIYYFLKQKTWGLFNFFNTSKTDTIISYEKKEYQNFYNKATEKKYLIPVD